MQKGTIFEYEHTPDLIRNLCTWTYLGEHLWPLVTFA